jgi:HSP20 family protein
VLRNRRILEWVDEVLRDIDEEFHPLWNAAEGCLEPLVDISSTEDTLIVTVDLPCVAKKEDISINASIDSLEVKATLHQNLRWNRWGTSQKEIEFGSFKTTVRLPVKVDPEKSRATFVGGILTVTLPRIQKKFSLKIG